MIYFFHVNRCRQQRAMMDKKHQEYLEDMEKERLRKVEAANRYQRLLDSQLKELRQRSLSSLEDTMAPKEKEMNSALLKKYGISYGK